MVVFCLKSRSLTIFINFTREDEMSAYVSDIGSSEELRRRKESFEKMFEGCLFSIANENGNLSYFLAHTNLGNKSWMVASLEPPKAIALMAEKRLLNKISLSEMKCLRILTRREK